MVSLRRRAASAPPRRPATTPVRSRKASSIDSGSTTGVKSSNSRRIRRDTSTYSPIRPGSQVACGQSRMATTDGIADRTPNGRASYEQVDTTPRGPLCPMISGTPASDGFSRTSIAA